MRAMIYARASTQAHEREDTSLETQERVCIEYARAAGWTVTQTIRDVASGASLGRPGIEAVRHALRDGACDVLIAYAVDRVSRNQDHVGVLQDDVEQAGASLEFVTTDS